MLVQFIFNGTIVCETESDCVPAMGAGVVFRSQFHAKGIKPNDEVAAVVSSVERTEYDYSGKIPFARIPINEVSVL